MFDATSLTPLPLTEKNRTFDETLADQKRTESLAAKERSRAEALADVGLSHAESAIFTALYYGFTIPPSELPRRASMEDYNPSGPVVTEEECRGALSACLANRWVQVIDEAARARIAGELRKGQVLGPIYGGLPEVGCVDFTDAGADLRRQFSERCWPDRRFSAYTDVVHER